MTPRTASNIPLHEWVKIPLVNYPDAPSVSNTLAAPSTTQARASTQSWAQKNLANARLKEKEGTVNDAEQGIKLAWQEFQVKVLQQDKSFLHLSHILSSDQPYNEASIRSEYAGQVIKPLIDHLKGNPEAATYWGIADIRDAWASIGLQIDLVLEIAEEDQITTAGGAGEGSVRVDTMSFFKIKGITVIPRRNEKRTTRTDPDMPRRAQPAITLLAKEIGSKRKNASGNTYLGIEQVWLDEILDSDDVKSQPTLLNAAVRAKNAKGSNTGKIQQLINLITSAFSKARTILPFEYKRYGYLPRMTIKAIALAQQSLGDSKMAGVGILQQGLRYTCAYGSRNILYIDYHGVTAARVPTTLIEDWKSTSEGVAPPKKGAAKPNSKVHEVWWTHAESSDDQDKDRSEKNAEVSFTIDGKEVKTRMTARLLTAFMFYLSIRDIRDWTDAVLEATTYTP